MEKIPHLNFSGFPGAGKTTITKKLIENYSTIVIPKVTTRSKRPDENGDEYIYVSMEEFYRQKDQNSFIAIEPNVVNGVMHYYAIPKVQHWPEIPRGTELILSAFGTEARMVKEWVPDIKLCFVTLSNLGVLADRLLHRCLQDGGNFEEKMKTIGQYLHENIQSHYDHIIYNDGNIEETLKQVTLLI